LYCRVESWKNISWITLYCVAAAKSGKTRKLTKETSSKRLLRLFPLILRESFFEWNRKKYVSTGSVLTSTWQSWNNNKDKCHILVRKHLYTFFLVSHFPLNSVAQWMDGCVNGNKENKRRRRKQKQGKDETEGKIK